MLQNCINKKANFRLNNIFNINIEPKKIIHKKYKNVSFHYGSRLTLQNSQKNLRIIFPDSLSSKMIRKIQGFSSDF